MGKVIGVKIFVLPGTGFNYFGKSPQVPLLSKYKIVDRFSLKVC